MDVFKRGKLLLGRKVGQQKHTILAIVLRKRRIVALGYNSYVKTHPLQAAFAKKVRQEKKEYLHAEVSALLKAPKDADTIVVLRANRAGDLCNASPCPVCREAIRQFGIKAILHS